MQQSTAESFLIADQSKAEGAVLHLRIVPTNDGGRTPNEGMHKEQALKIVCHHATTYIASLLREQKIDGEGGVHEWVRVMHSCGQECTIVALWHAGMRVIDELKKNSPRDELWYGKSLAILDVLTAHGFLCAQDMKQQLLLEAQIEVAEQRRDTYAVSSLTTDRASLAHAPTERMLSQCEDLLQRAQWESARRIALLLCEQDADAGREFFLRACHGEKNARYNKDDFSGGDEVLRLTEGIGGETQKRQ